MGSICVRMLTNRELYAAKLGLQSRKPKERTVILATRLCVKTTETVIFDGQLLNVKMLALAKVLA